MPKQPANSLENMMRARTERAAEPAEPEIMPKVVPIVRKAANAKPASEIEKLSLYLPKGVNRFLKQVALETDRKPHDLLLEGVDFVLKQHGKKLKDFQE